jgi:hypothetical protein
MVGNDTLVTYTKAQNRLIALHLINEEYYTNLYLQQLPILEEYSKAIENYVILDSLFINREIIYKQQIENDSITIYKLDAKVTQETKAKNKYKNWLIGSVTLNAILLIAILL